MTPAFHGNREESRMGPDFLNVSISIFLKMNPQEFKFKLCFITAYTTKA